MRNKNGFTIIELMVTIVIIALLATIATMSLVNVQKQARDSRRSSNAATLAENLEKYFAKNGEYPSVSKVTSSSSSSVQSLLGLPNNTALLDPSAAAGTANSWGTGAAAANKTLTYSGNTDVSASCTTGNSATDSCVDFKIQYYNEQDGTIVTITSRHTSSTVAQLNPSATSGAPVVTVSYVSPNVKASWPAITCSSGTPRYAYQSRTNDGTWSSWSDWQTGTSTTTAPIEGTKFGYVAKAQCYNTTYGTYGSDSATSAEATYIYPVTTVPTAPGVYVTGSFRPYAVSSGICMDASGGAAVGANIQIYGCNGTAAQDWAWNSTDGTIRSSSDLTLCINLNGGGTQFTLATCNGGNNQKFARYNDGTFHTISGNYCVDDANWGTANGTSIGAGNCNGATAQMWNPTDSQNAWTWPDVTCNGNASPQYQINYQQTGIADSGWSNIGTTTRVVRTTSSQGYSYNSQVKARCVSPYATGSWSATGQASIQKAVLPPPAPSGFSYWVNGGNRYNMSWGWNFTLNCGAGASLYYIEDEYIGGSGSPVYWVSPRQPNGPNQLGWWTADSTGGNSPGYILWGPEGARQTSDSYAGASPAPSGVPVAGKAQGYCKNTSTGWTSAWGPWGQANATL